MGFFFGKTGSSFAYIFFIKNEAAYLDSGLRDNLRRAQAVRMVDLDGQDFLAQTLGVYESL